MRIGVIGCGSIGRRHIANLLALGERDVLIYDSHEGQKADASATYDVPLAPRLEDVWNSRPAAVLICTPPDSHLRLAAEARIQGIRGIFVEKPLGLSRMFGAEVMDDCITMVACNWRYHPAFSALKRWIEDGAVRQPATFHAILAYDLAARPDYRTCYAATTGVILDVAWHLVDAATWLFGPAHLRNARAWPSERLGLPCDGGTEIELVHAGGSISRLLADFDSGITERSISIVGVDKQPNIKMLVEPTDEMYVDELRYFLACVREQKTAVNPISEAARTLAILLEAKTWVTPSP